MILTEAKDVRVNGITIPPTMIDEATQYHPADSHRNAMIQATESLVINELVRQRAFSEGLIAEQDVLNTEQAYEMCLELIDQAELAEKLNDEACQRFYSANPARFTSAPLMEMRHILCAAAPDELERRAEQRELAERLLKSICSGEQDFAELASNHSDCPSKSEGGLLGQISSGQLIPEFERQVFAAGIGVMQRPIETRFGYHLVEILQKEQGRLLPYDLVVSRIRDYLSDQFKRHAIANLIRQLASNAKIDGFSFAVADDPLVQ